VQFSALPGPENPLYIVLGARGENAMGYLTGDDRMQGCLLPLALDDYIDQDASARIADAIVDMLDFQTLSFNRAADDVRTIPDPRY
jgi:hypothetical protein